MFLRISSCRFSDLREEAIAAIYMSMAIVQLSFLSEALELDMGEKQQELQAASIDIALLRVIASNCETRRDNK